MGLEVTKPVFRVSNKVRLKPVSSATENREENETLPVARLDMIFSKKGITKVLIRLRIPSVQTGLRLCCSQTPKTGFLALRPIWLGHSV